jgi:hypothetical protein
MTAVSTTAAVVMTASATGNLSSILGAQEAYAFGNQIFQDKQQYNINCSATACYNGPLPAFFPYTNIADVTFSDSAFVNQNAFQLNGMCLDATASCINLATNYDFQQFTLFSNVLQYNNQQDLGIMGPGAVAYNEGLNQAIQVDTAFGGIFQSNDSIMWTALHLDATIKHTT